MARVFRSITLNQEVLNQLEEEVKKNSDFCCITEDTLTKDHMLWIRSLSPLISSIDPIYNGGDTSTLGDKWYRAEDNAASNFEEFQTRLKLIHTLLRFKMAKITEYNRGIECNNPIHTKYSLTDVDSKIIEIIQRELPKFTEMRKQPITSESCESISECESLIDAIDTQYRGENFSTISQGLSLAEQWYQVAIDYEENYEFDTEELEDIYERYYTILYTLSKYKLAVTICSPDGSKC